jgi:hypothetical protein
VSDRGAPFVAHFWEQLQESLGTHVIRSSAYHPQTDGQTERVNQILEDMLRACVLHYGKHWDKCLSLAKFSYNNSYQSSLKMAPFEALYGRRCRTPLNWSQAEEREIFGPDLVLEAEEKVRVIKKNLEAAQARQKSYHDKRRKPLHFQVGGHVYLKVSPTKGVQRFGIKGKLAPRYIGPYEIIEICGPMAYQLKLPPHMSAVHDVFHVSQLWKCVRLPTEVLPEPELEIEPDLSYQEHPSRYWIKRRDQHGQGRSGCIRFSGVITKWKRLCGRLRIFYVLASSTFCPKESVRNPKPHPHLPFESKYKRNLDVKGIVSFENNFKRTSF